MIKKLNILPLILALLLAACAKEDIPTNSVGSNAIAFASTTSTATRATGVEAAKLLANQFVVYGSKKRSETETQTVFPIYEVKYIANTANTTESNTHGWEYVGQDAAKAQEIKYWDFSASEYNFKALSYGSADHSTVSFTLTEDATSVTGAASEIVNVYLSDKKKVVSDYYAKEVQLRFRALAARIRLGLYETIPGYSVKEVKFYESDGDSDGDEGAVMYASSGFAATGGKYTVTYDAQGKAQVEFSQDGTEYGDAESQMSIGALTNFANKYVDEAEELVYLGRSSISSTITEYTKVLPVNSGTALKLKVDYTLLSTDGSGQTIHVKGATAAVPAAYAHWKSNYAYTYLFKISDNTNGYTGETADPAGLYPLTFDAWSMITDDTPQGTITTFGDYSITTYQEGSTNDDGVSYKMGKAIDVTVIKGDGSETEKVALNGIKDFIKAIPQNTKNESDIDSSQGSAEVTYSDGKATFKPQQEAYYRVEYWHIPEGETEAVKLAVKIVKVGNPSAEGANIEASSEVDNDYRHAPGRGIKAER